MPGALMPFLIEKRDIELFSSWKNGEYFEEFETRFGRIQNCAKYLKTYEYKKN